MPRILFEKTGSAVYISHLDLMRVFQRAFKRAGLLIRHSQGFTPRAHVSIALPLSVGAESVCELLDFELAEGTVINTEEIPTLLNRTMPAGIHVREIWENGRKLRELTHLDAEVTLEYDKGIPEGCVAALEALFTGDAPIIAPKRSKNGMTVQDIRPMIVSFAAEAVSEQEVKLKTRVCAQNPSLNPALLVQAIFLHQPELIPDFSRVKRLEVLDKEGKAFR